LPSKIKVLKLDDKTIEFELVGEDHTMANLIAKYAVRKPYVKYAAYNIPHPLVSNPVIVITTDGSRKPLDVLAEVLRDIIADAEELRSKLAEVLGVSEEGG
jgi:DNA-directed RNA polymerase subunit L